MTERAEQVVIVHGLWMPGAETLPLRRRLAAAGFAPVLYRYPTVTAGLGANIERLATFLASLAANSVHMVGYSLGGVLAVGAAQRGLACAPGRIVCLGAPLNGSAAGRSLAALPFGSALVGASIVELNRRGGLGGFEGTREVGCIAGSGGFGMGRLIAALADPNDGTVTVEETRLPGLADHLVLPVTHTTMLFDATVAAQTIAFLRTGAFDRPGTLQSRRAAAASR